MHGVAGPSTVHFLDDKMAEPSLSRMHQAVETATTATESALNNRLLVSAKLLCYHAGELLASSRLDCAGFKPREIGLDAQLCRIFLQEAEDLALCIEAAICDIRKARRDLSGLFKWFKALHAFVGMHKKSTSNDVDDDFFKFILKARDQQGIASFLVAGKLIESASYSSNTEAILDFEVTKLLADLKPGSVKAPMTSFRPQNISNLTPEAIADQIRSCVEKERKADTAKASYSPPVLDHVDNDDLSDAEAFVIHAKLRAVGVTTNSIFANTRSALAKTVKYRASAQFPAERLQEVQDRVTFNAHLPDPSTVQSRGAFAPCLEHISALIQATPTTLWLLRSLHHDAMRIWLGLKAPRDTNIIQASFYANEQGIYCKNSHRIAVLAQKKW